MLVESDINTISGDAHILRAPDLTSENGARTSWLKEITNSILIQKDAYFNIKEFDLQLQHVDLCLPPLRLFFNTCCIDHCTVPFGTN